MKKIKSIIFIMAIFSMNIFAQTSNSFQQVSSAINDYRLVWQDNFDGTQLNSNNWVIEVNGEGGGNNELQYYRRENVSVGIEPVSGANCLILTAKKENYSGKTCTSGRVNTLGKMSFKHGKIEARIKLPHTANGLWPAFWMMGADWPSVGWPKCGEIDILEMGNSEGIRNGTQDRYFNGACHWGETWQNHPMYARATTNPYSLQDDFHLFTLVWDENVIKMYLDLDKYPSNNPYYEMNISQNSDPSHPCHYFHKPFFVIFNLAIGGDFTGIRDINNVTALNAGNNYQAKMYVDYVKVYQKGDTSEEYHGPTMGINKTTLLNKFNIIPNPFFDQITISGEKVPSLVTVYNVTGKMILQVSNSNIIQTSNLPEGIYFIKIKDSNGRVENHKIIKENK
ncbi:MAG TPA: family 16 glycosylhydrolase [Paludibacteraceae bacterium]|nr:family 16 glycosylhydrolase [Paludibacteraceae bacterium]HOL00731.1 family 16 glycosylhydrolase [Paludibacteraceae bacterium]HPO67437.1 family 16 glycosylhydrolase [Paludibacteraceae bacterium]